MSPTAQTDHYPLVGSAKPVMVVYNPHDKNIWFLTQDAKFGKFVPSSHESVIFPPDEGGKTAQTLVSWERATWTYAQDSKGGRVVSCSATGHYDNRGKSSAANCPAMAIGKNFKGDAEIIVATLSGKNALTLIDAQGNVSTSNAYPTPLQGIAIGRQNPQEYWVSSPGAKSVVEFDASTGEFSKSPVNLNAEPGHLAITESSTERALWVATTGKKVIKRRLDGDPTLQEVDTPAVPDRLFALADGSLWFTMPDIDTVGYVLPGQTTVAGSIPTGKGSKPSGIAVDADSQLWIGLKGTGEMFRVSKFRLTPLSGQGQETKVGAWFPDRLKVKATKLDGTPVKGAGITFAVTGEQARFEGNKPTDPRTTDGEGIAESARLQAKKVGPVSVSATWTDKGVSTPFENITVKDEVGPADRVAYQSGAGQKAEAGQGFTDPLVVVVQDKNGAPVPDIKVTFRILDDMASFKDSGATAEVLSVKDGSASSPALIAGSDPGRFKVEAWAEDTFAGVVFREYVTG